MEDNACSRGAQILGNSFNFSFKIMFFFSLNVVWPSVVLVKLLYNSCYCIRVKYFPFKKSLKYLCEKDILFVRDSMLP